MRTGSTEAFRLRRSVLYMPGANERALEKAASLPADALILDLEDAVAPDAKEDARDRVCTAAGSGRYGHREVTIRANSIGTRWHDADVDAIATSGAAAIVIPKVNQAEDVQQVVAALEAAGAPGDLDVWAMIETPEAILNARDIATAHGRLAAFVLGTNDLVKELRAEFVPGRQPLLPSLSMAVLGARAAGVAVLDGVFNDLDDAEAFEAECHQGRQLGMDGKTLIHPRQLEPCNRVFSPSEDEVVAAREVIAAFEEAMERGLGVATVKGRLIENLHVEQAQRVVSQADAIAARGA